MDETYRSASIIPAIPAFSPVSPNVLVLINTNLEEEHRRYFLNLKTFFYHLGLSFREMDVKNGLGQLDFSPSLILLGHSGIWDSISKCDRDLLLKWITASGLVSFDLSTDHAPMAYQIPLGLNMARKESSLIDFLEIQEGDNLVKGLQTRYVFRYPCPAVLVPPVPGRTIHFRGHPLVIKSQVDEARILQVMISSQVLNEGVLGHINKLSTFFERALIWASKKPFALKTIPHFLSIRVDDVSGASGFSYLDPICKHHFIPLLGLLLEDLPERSLNRLKKLNAMYPLSLSPHGLTWEKPLYFDVSRKRELNESQLEENFWKIDTFYGKHGLRLPKTLNAHFYSVGIRCKPFLLERGIRYVMNEIPLGSSRGTFWPTALPYGRNSYNLCFADSSEEIVNFSFQGFGRSSYLAPHDHDWLWGCTPYHGENMKVDADQAVRRGVEHIERAFWAKFPAYLMTHEQRLSLIDPLELDSILWRIEASLHGDGFTPVYENMDSIIDYLVSAWNVRIYEVNQTAIRLQGEAVSGIDIDVHMENSTQHFHVPPFSGQYGILLEESVEK
jgi:hypothetical protein